MGTRVSHWLNRSLFYAIGMVVLISVADLIPDGNPNLKYVAFPLACAFFGYGVYLGSHYRNSQVEQEVDCADEQWTCVLTDESFTSFDRKGIGYTVPWREMEVEFETDDIWVIRFDHRHMYVEREPLRQAGLEDEFRSRVRVR